MFTEEQEKQLLDTLRTRDAQIGRLVTYERMQRTHQFQRLPEISTSGGFISSDDAHTYNEPRHTDDMPVRDLRDIALHIQQQSIKGERFDYALAKLAQTAHEMTAEEAARAFGSAHFARDTSLLRVYLQHFAEREQDYLPMLSEREKTIMRSSLRLVKAAFDHLTAQHHEEDVDASLAAEHQRLHPLFEELLKSLDLQQQTAREVS